MPSCIWFSVDMKSMMPSTKQNINIIKIIFPLQRVRPARNRIFIIMQKLNWDSTIHMVSLKNISEIETIFHLFQKNMYNIKYFQCGRLCCSLSCRQNASVILVLDPFIYCNYVQVNHSLPHWAPHMIIFK
jgi:hypothetical protein